MKKTFSVVMIVIALILVGCENHISNEITLIGTWTANDTTVNSRVVNEVLNFNSNGTYLVEGRYADTNEVVATGSGTFTYTSDKITYTTDPNNLKVESYSIDQDARTLTMIASDHTKKIWFRK